MKIFNSKIACRWLEKTKIAIIVLAIIGFSINPKWECFFLYFLLVSVIMYFVSLTQRKIKENIAREFFPEIFREIKTLEKEIENEIYLPRVSELQEELRYKRKKFDTLVREYLKK